MLELDYAFLADFATIQDGTLTVVGASFTRMVVTEYPTFALLGVAGRIRCDEPDRNTINVTLRITSPGAEPTTIEAVNALDASEKAKTVVCNAKIHSRSGALRPVARLSAPSRGWRTGRQELSWPALARRAPVPGQQDR